MNKFIISILCSIVYFSFIILYTKFLYEVISNKSNINITYNVKVTVDKTNKLYLIFASIFNIMIFIGAIYFMFKSNINMNLFCIALFIANTAGMRRKYGSIIR